MPLAQRSITFSILLSFNSLVPAQDVDAKVSAPLEPGMSNNVHVLEIGESRFYTLRLEKSPDGPRGSKLGELTSWSIDEMLQQYAIMLTLPTEGSTEITLHEAVEFDNNLSLYYSFEDTKNKRRVLTRVVLDENGSAISPPAVVMECPPAASFMTLKDAAHGTVAIFKSSFGGFVQSDRYLSLDRYGSMLLDVTLAQGQVPAFLPIAGHVDAKGSIYFACYAADYQQQRAPAYFMISISNSNGVRSWPAPDKAGKQRDMGPYAFKEDGEGGVHLIHPIGDGAGMGNSNDITGFKTVSFSSTSGDRVGEVRHMLQGSILKKADAKPSSPHRIEWGTVADYLSNSDGTIDIVGRQDGNRGTNSLWKITLHPERGPSPPVVCRYSRTHAKHVGISFHTETFRTHWIRISGSTNVIAREFVENMGRSCATALPWSDVSATNGKSVLASLSFLPDGPGMWKELALDTSVPIDATPFFFERGGADGSTYVIQLHSKGEMRWLRIR